MLVSLKVYQQSVFGPALVYMKHRHMVCGKSHLLHELVLDKKSNYNYYSTLLLHEALDVDHKMVMRIIALYYNKFSHLLWNISIILNMIFSVCEFSFAGSFSVFALINDYMFTMLFRKMVLELFSHTDIIFVCKNTW